MMENIVPTKKFAISVPIDTALIKDEASTEIGESDLWDPKYWYEQYFIPPKFNITEISASDLLRDKNHLFHSLYTEGLSTKEVCSLSLAERSAYKALLQSQDTHLLMDGKIYPRATTYNSLTYGEMIDIYPLYTIFLLLQRNNLLPMPGTGKFYDLGSGSGRIIMAACLLYPFQHYIGIEILSSLVQISNQVKDRYLSTLSLNHEDKERDTFDKNENLETFQWTAFPSHPSIQFIHDTIDLLPSDRLLSTPELDWTQGDIIFINSTCFDATLMTSISHSCARLTPGSIIITLTHMLLPEISQCDCLHELRLEMNW